MKKKQTAPAKLLYFASEQNADMLYFARFFAPDPFIAMEIHGRKIGVFNMLEYSRALKEAALDEVLSYEETRTAAAKLLRLESPSTADIILFIARKNRVKHFLVPDTFPVGLAFELQRRGLKLSTPPSTEPFFPERILKTREEADAIRVGNRASAAGIKAAEQALRKSTIRNGYLYLNGKRLTSERLRTLIDQACLGQGATASRTICAGGDQACDPHCHGTGPLRANELIIVDVFPRVAATGYHGDMTRTFLRGKASPAQKHLVQTVLEAQKLACAKVKAGVALRSVHEVVHAHFKQQGYETSRDGGTWKGFFHSTGHGLGLDIHEAPRLSYVPGRLQSGMVVTVEPGLYYPGLGGCRIEDVLWVTKSGSEKLSSYGYHWELQR